MTVLGALNMLILTISLGILAVFGVLELLHILSYIGLKRRNLNRQTWDLNICSGKTDGGGVNADICRGYLPASF